MEDYIYSTYGDPLLDTVIRILLAALFGSILGFERMRKMRAASIRTYTLVSVGACMTVLTSLYLYRITGGAADPARIPAQTVCGVGFIGAGAIITSGYHKKKGITTAAGIWVSACIGLAVGASFIWGALIMVTITMVVLKLLEQIQSAYHKKSRYFDLFVIFDNADFAPEFFRMAKEEHLYLSDFDVHSQLGSSVCTTFSVRLKDKRSHQDVIDLIENMEGVSFVEAL